MADSSLNGDARDNAGFPPAQRHCADGASCLEVSPAVSIAGPEAAQVAGIRATQDWLTHRDQLQHLQKMAMAGLLAGTIAHEFNNLLTSVMGYTELARAGLEDDNPSRGDLDQVLAAGRRATTLTRQLLALSRRQRRKTDAFDLNTLVRDYHPLLQRLMPDGVRIVLDCEPDALIVRGDRGQIEIALLNLALNARDAMPAGGTLTIETSLRSGQGTITAAQALLRVTDTGAGMSDEIRGRLFEPFFTTRNSASGLGLATTRAIVTNCGGSIDVATAPGKGSSFTLQLPACAGDDHDADRTAAALVEHLYEQAIR